MAGEYTPGEVEQRYLEAMGPELGRLFYCLWNECAWLHLKWSEYVILFGSKPERLSLLNTTAPAFFRLIRDSMWEDVLLHICRLTDPTQSIGKQKKQNLTLQRLPPLVEPALRLKVERLLQAALEKCAFARDWRNRRIGHRDLGLALKGPAVPLAPARRGSVNDALEAIAAVLNAVERRYRNMTVPYHMVTPSLGDAEALLCILRDGLKMRAAREARLRERP